MPPRPASTHPRSPLDQPQTANRRRSKADRRQMTTERRQAFEGIPEALTRRVIVERIRPSIDNGRWPVKRTVGEPVQVGADIFADGHDVIAAVLRDRPRPGNPESGAASAVGEWRETPMALVAPGTD